jgi:hypothetical protein
VTYCTVDVAPPRLTVATGNLSVPRKAGRLSTVAYLHGTSVSFYDAPSNPDVFGEFNENGESFDGPPSSALFAGGGFIYVALDYLGLGGSSVPRHRYFHAATEASSAADLLAASVASSGACGFAGATSSSRSASRREATRRWRSSGRWSVDGST